MAIPTVSDEKTVDDDVVDELLANSKIDRGDLLRNDPALRVGLNWLKIYRHEDAGRPHAPPRGLLHLGIAILVPLLIFAVVTKLESRFSLGSVTAPAEYVSTGGWFELKTFEPAKGYAGRKVKGMSFLGDTMVWPFVIMIPLLFVLLNQALGRFEKFSGSTRSLLSRSWLLEHPAEYSRIVAGTRSIVRGEGIWRYLRWVAITAGLGLVGFNAVKCTIPISPYTTGEPLVQVQSGSGTYEKVTLEPPKEVLLPKWDTDFKEARMSWLATRLWALLLGYFWLPLFIYKLLNLVAATYFYTHRLSKHESALAIKLLSPDSAGGLSKLASLASGLTYPVMVMGVMLTMQFIKESSPPALYNILLSVSLVPVFAGFFMVPLLGVHRAMSAAKQEYLREYAGLFDRVHAKFLEEVESPSLDMEGFSRLEVSMRGLTRSYDRISKMSVWPFEISALYRLMTVGLGPVLVPILVKQILKYL